MAEAEGNTRRKFLLSAASTTLIASDGFAKAPAQAFTPEELVRYHADQLVSALKIADKTIYEVHLTTFAQARDYKCAFLVTAWRR